MSSAKGKDLINSAIVGAAVAESAQPWRTLPDSGGTIQSSNLRAEIVLARSHEADAIQEVAALRNIIENMQSEGARKSQSLQLLDEVRQSNEHSRLIEEYADRLQAVVAMRDGEMADLRSELQMYRRRSYVAHPSCDSPPSFQQSCQSYLDMGTDCEKGEDLAKSWQHSKEALVECKEALRSECHQVASLRQEVSASGSEECAPRLRLQVPRSRSMAEIAEDTICGFAVTAEDAFRRFGVPCNGGDANHSLSGASRLLALRSSGQTSDAACIETLRSDLSRCLQDNVRLESSVQRLTAETAEARVLQQACFDQQQARFHNAETAWQEEANIARTLRADLNANMDAIADLSQWVRKGVKEVADSEEEQAVAEQKAKSLQAELYVQNAQVQLLRSEFRQSRIPTSKDIEDQEFEEHVREVMEMATIFKSELSCVKKASNDVGHHELEAMVAQLTNRELEAQVRDVQTSAVRQASQLEGELDFRNREIIRLKSELCQMTSYRDRSPGRLTSHRDRSPGRSKSPSRVLASSGSSSLLLGKSMFRTTTPSRREPASLPLQTATPRINTTRIITTTPVRPAPTLCVPARESAIGSSTPQMVLRRPGVQEALPAAIPPASVFLGTRECGAVSPAPCPRTVPVALQPVLQAESARTVQERLRQRIMGSSSPSVMHRPLDQGEAV